MSCTTHYEIHSINDEHFLGKMDILDTSTSSSQERICWQIFSTDNMKFRESFFLGKLFEISGNASSWSHFCHFAEFFNQWQRNLFTVTGIIGTNAIAFDISVKVHQYIGLEIKHLKLRPWSVEYNSYAHPQVPQHTRHKNQLGFKGSIKVPKESNHSPLYLKSKKRPHR